MVPTEHVWDAKMSWFRNRFQLEQTLTKKLSVSAILTLSSNTDDNLLYSGQTTVQSRHVHQEIRGTSDNCWLERTEKYRIVLGQNISLFLTNEYRIR